MRKERDEKVMVDFSFRISVLNLSLNSVPWRGILYTYFMDAWTIFKKKRKKNMPESVSEPEEGFNFPRTRNPLFWIL